MEDGPADIKDEFTTNVGQGDHKPPTSLKSSLKAWREIVVWAYRLLLWEKPFYPAILFGMITLKFLAIWYLDPSVVTCVAIGIMNLCILDFAMPLLSPIVFPEHNWTSEKEDLYKAACEDIKKAKLTISSLFNSFIGLKSKNPWLYMAAVTVTLSTLAWLGSQMHNLFLFYLFWVVLTAVPGLVKQGYLDKAFEKFNKLTKKQNKKGL